jgi:hypothetical protein
MRRQVMKDKGSPGSNNDSIKRGGNASPRRTIVGGRPPGEMIVTENPPTGIQKLLLAASLDEGFNERLHVNPLDAARELGFELSGSEEAILASVPPEQLGHMVERIKIPGIDRRKFLLTSAATLAAVVATSFGVNAQGGGSTQSRGISPDIPTPGYTPLHQGTTHTRGISMEVPPVKWLQSVDAAKLEAKNKKRLIMAVYSPPAPDPAKEITPKSTGTVNWNSVTLCCFADPGLRRMIHAYGILPCWVSDDTLAGKNKVAKFPTVIFLTEKGMELSRIVQPQFPFDMQDALSGAAKKYGVKPLFEFEIQEMEK